ncbi:MAG: hypothetical protein IAE89_08760 [Anaerolineae bacterium]|nr:hypothetical protein [Anaerolineae bacterium]
MSANIEAMVREGIAAVKAGNKDDGRVLLNKAVELDPYNEEGWLWLSGVVDGQDDQRTCLENVLAINPANEKARKGLDFLSGKPSAPSLPPTPPTEPPATPAASVTSVEWDFGATETSSASSSRSAPEPSAQDYDDWVSGLGLKTDTDDSNAEATAASPFVGFDDDFFSAGPFDDGEEAAPQEERSNIRAAAPSPTPQSITYTPPPDDFGEAFPGLPPEPEVAPTPKGGKKRGSKLADDGLGVPIAAAASAAIPVPLETEDDFDDFGVAAEIFPTIPKTITATRIPGTNESPPYLLVLISLLLIALNVGVAIMLAMKLLAPG